MPVDIISNTTLAAAIDDSDNNFTVASTTGISAGNLLVVNGEAMKVNAVNDPATGYLKVVRGVNGTRPQAHANADRAFFGAPNVFKAVRSGAERLGLSGAAGADLPEYLMPGNRAWDNRGNEFVMLELSQTSPSGTTVLISRDGNYTAIPLASGLSGSVAVLSEGGSSDQYVWGQVYGRCPYAQLVGGSSLMTSTGVLQPATSVSTPAVGLLGLTTSQASSVDSAQIRGMFPASAASTATTSASSATGLSCTLWLNYPFVLRTVSS